MNKEKLDSLPASTGVYKFIDANGSVLYIGKALNLKARVKSYFQKGNSDRPHIIKMIPLVRDVEVLETDNEIESLILESALVKHYKPKFNMDLKDDKSFAWIYISTHEKFPKISIVRSIKKDDFKKGILFGPYPKGSSIKSIFNYVRKLYPFATCKNSKEICLYYHLKLCPGSCESRISVEDYRNNIQNIIKFLEGKQRNLMKDLEKQMRNYASSEDFEKASLLRDKIQDLEYLSIQTNNSSLSTENNDIQGQFERFKKSLISLESDLNISNISRIECYDVSNIKGLLSYGSISVFEGFKMFPDQYRIFKLREGEGDIQMLSELLRRRLRYLGGDIVDNSLVKRPDIILLDGGFGHISSLHKIIPSDIRVVAISKGKSLKKKGLKIQDEFWVVQNGNADSLLIKDPFLLTKLRDEAHRFAIKHYRKAKQKQARNSDLDNIIGIGVKRRKLLLKNFKSLGNLKKASINDLNRVLKNIDLSKRVYEHFKN